MNIFLPYENDINKSVQSLDNLRLNKQILETYQLLTNAIKEKRGQDVKGYTNHPVYVFYKTNLPFLMWYGYSCCREYQYRFQKPHKLTTNFMSAIMLFNVVEENVAYIPYYMEGSKGQPNYIRTTENVSALFQQKLINKWNNDNAKGRQPRWTNRNIPDFYIKYLQEVENG